MEKSFAKPIYKRILLKLSGEALQNDQHFGIDIKKLNSIVTEIKGATELGVQVAVVIGAGNLIRGADFCAEGFDRVTADQMGMLATIVNGLALRDSLNQNDIPATMLSALGVSSIAEQYDRSHAIDRLNEGKVVVLAGGTGNPLVTTDSAAALRAIEINADIVIKATKVDGVYSADPLKNKDAKQYTRLGYDEILANQLTVMDLNSILLCKEHDLPLRVFNMNKKNALRNIMLGENIGTLITASV